MPVRGRLLPDRPGPLRGGAYAFDIGTAGAACLPLQTLAFTDTPRSLASASRLAPRQPAAGTERRAGGLALLAAGLKNPPMPAK